MDSIEQWIKRRSAAAVEAGLGEWADGPATALGRPIYRVTDGAMTFVLSQLGFMYDGPSASFVCRYDEVETLDLASFQEIMPRNGDLNRLLTLGVSPKGASARLELQFPLLIYNQVTSVLPQIVDELA